MLTNITVNNFLIYKSCTIFKMQYRMRKNDWNTTAKCNVIFAILLDVSMQSTRIYISDKQTKLS